MSNLDNQPLRYWRGHSIYLCHYLTVALAAGIVAMLLLSSALFPIGWFAFNPITFLAGAVWQPFTYLFVNQVDFFTPLALLCFYSWGVEVEKYLGRKTFLGIVAAVALLPLAYYLALYPLGIYGQASGIYDLTIGLLIAFAALYPNLDYLGGWVPLKWFAFVCLACGSITHFPAHDWAGLMLLWLECGVAYVMVRAARGLFDFHFRWPSWPRRQPKLRVLPRAERVFAPAPAPLSKAESDMDALLDKIARDGLPSLSPAERERLEQARQEMLRKER